MSAGSVVTGMPSSLVVATIASRSATVSSEHTASVRNGVVAFAVHSCNVWDSSDNEGHKTRMHPAPRRSANPRETRVLPVHTP